MEFKIVQKIVGNIQSTIENAAVATVNALKAHTFNADVRVKNFPKNQKVNGVVSVSNQRRVEKELKKNGTTQKSMLKWLKGFKMPKSIEVSNFPKPEKFPKFPTEIKVKNFPKQKEFPKNIRVSNQPSKELKDLSKKIAAVEKAVKALKLDPKINVDAPKIPEINVPEPSVTVTQKDIDYEKLASLIPVPEKIDYDKLAEKIGKELGEMVVSIGSGGGSRKEGQDDLTREYNISDKDESSTPKYYGFVGRSGNWYILKESGTEYRYVRGSQSYVTNWDNRASLDYARYNEVF